MAEFFIRPISEDDINGPAGTGFVKIANIGEDTTYEQYFKDIYNQFDFPTKSLYENQCVAFCPEPPETNVGYASVNGVCLECKSPCETCKKEVTRCKSCKQD